MIIMTETTFLVDWAELKSSEADVIIFRVGDELVSPTKHAIQKFKDQMEKFFVENKIDIPILVLAKATVEVEAIIKKEDDDDETDTKDKTD